MKTNVNNTINSIVSKDNGVNHETLVFLAIFDNNGKHVIKSIAKAEKSTDIIYVSDIVARLNSIYDKRKEMYYRDTFWRNLEITEKMAKNRNESLRRDFENKNKDVKRATIKDYSKYYADKKNSDHTVEYTSKTDDVFLVKYAKQIRALNAVKNGKTFTYGKKHHLMSYENKKVAIRLLSIIKLHNTAKSNTLVNHLARCIVTKYKSNDVTYASDIQLLCAILAQSRINRLINPKRDNASTDTTFKTMWYKWKYDIHIVSRFETMVHEYNDCFETHYNSKGKMFTKCTDCTSAKQILKKIAKLSDNIGYDLVSTAIVKCLDILHNMPENAKSNYLLANFETVKKSTKYDKNGDLRDKSLWKYDATNYVKEISKEISKYIREQRQVMASTEIFETVVCGDGDYIKYKTVNQLDKLAYTSYVNSFDCTTVDNKDKMVISEMISKIMDNCKLSPQEKSVFTNYFIKGKTIGFVATKLDISDSSVKTCISRIRTKIIDSGIFGNIAKSATFTAAHTEISVSVYDIHNKLVGVYSSIGNCSKALGLDKSTVAKRIRRGDNATAYKGYYFRVNVK